MKSNQLGLVLPLILVTCALAFAADYVKPSDIQKVNLGDTFDHVSQKIGESQQVLSKSLDPQGKEQVVWAYEAIEKPDTKAYDHFLTGRTQDEAYKAEKQYQLQRAVNPPYLIIFTDGKVSNVKRQELQSANAAQIDVTSY